MEPKQQEPRGRAKRNDDYWIVPVRIPSHMKATIFQHQEASGARSMNAYLLDAIIQRSNPTLSPEQPKTAEAAAWTLFACLNAGHQAMIQELVTATGTPLSLYFLSHLHLVYEQGQLAYRVAEEQLPEGSVPARAEQVHALKEVMCEYCAKPLMQTTEGQRFHLSEVDGEDGCGTLHAKSVMRSHRMRDDAGQPVAPGSGPSLI